MYKAWSNNLTLSACLFLVIIAFTHFVKFISGYPPCGTFNSLCSLHVFYRILYFLLQRYCARACENTRNVFDAFWINIWYIFIFRIASYGKNYSVLSLCYISLTLLVLTTVCKISSKCFWYLLDKYLIHFYIPNWDLLKRYFCIIFVN